MNYIIWKNIDSRSIPGLLICELPSITKPKMRMQITEIEGKDGDFSDNLGYSAYDKTLKIALTKNFDINGIIQYFSGTSQVTFSNEPDKFYNAEIIEQVDFERLIKFRAATVKFHTQPFKYLVKEEPTELFIDYETELTVTNQGLKPSKPVIMLFGEGVVEIAINGLAQFQVDFGDLNSHLTVDSEIEECYKDNLQTLKNRNMTGIFPTLQPGENVVSWSGNLIKIEVHARSRWL